MNPGYNKLNYDLIMTNATIMNIPVQVFESDIFDVTSSVVEGSPCYLCARMRRGALYAKAKELGCNKIALGHHYDDVIETILMGMLYGGQIQTMMPKLHSTNFEGMELIRPMYLIREEDIKHWCNYNELKFIACACKMTEKRDTAVNPGDVSKRAETKELIRQLREKSPYIESNIFKSVENVHLNAIISYKTNKTGRHHFLDTYDEDDL
jgi:tRNA(Ile)-lysidine synthase TilS/MesJ